VDARFGQSNEHRFGVYKTGARLASVDRHHCPPVLASDPIIDDVWIDIIYGFVPKERIQIIPLEVRCKDGISKKYSLVSPLDQVLCIDPSRSSVSLKIEKEDITLIFACKKFVHHPNCMGDSHFAADKQMSSYLLISDGLRDALASTGESSMFYQPRDLPLR
jgi:hypothetical protein